jgi:hypothetical protein
VSDVPQAPGWWQASDGKWYPPEQFTGATQPQTPAPQTPQPQGYQNPGYGYGQSGPPKNDGLAVGALVTSIVGIPLLCCYIGFFACVAGVVMGFVSRNRIKQSGGQLTGEGMAMGGIIVGFVGIALAVIGTILYIAGVATLSYGSS